MAGVSAVALQEARADRSSRAPSRATGFRLLASGFRLGTLDRIALRPVTYRQRAGEVPSPLWPESRSVPWRMFGGVNEGSHSAPALPGRSSGRKRCARYGEQGAIIHEAPDVSRRILDDAR